MTTITFEITNSDLATHHPDPDKFINELRIAAAIKWYELGRVSQGMGAEVANLARSEFIMVYLKLGFRPLLSVIRT